MSTKKKTASKEASFNYKSLLQFLISKAFYKHLLLIIGFLLIILVSVLIWLNIYTNHGQELELPDYRGQFLEQVEKDAKKRKFLVVVDDSTHVVGKKGGEIIDQNPKPRSKVKENRKIYVTITKFQPDKIKLSDLPALYGRNYNSKKRELSILQINSRIRDYKYDRGEPDYILEAYYNGQQILSREGQMDGVEIEKGSTIEFVLSKKSGGSIDLPNLRCMTLEQAVFLLESTNLQMGAVRQNGVITTNAEGFVTDQIPPYSPDAKVTIGSTVELIISEEKPVDCD
jgi:beta-lactam-binding protein with PASTA domain